MSQIELFDYSALSPDLQVEVKTATERIKLRMKRTAEDIIEIGKDLIAIKEKLPHGQFLPWVASEFEMSNWTASQFMNVAEKFGDKLEIISSFNPTVLYQLAAPSTPDEVVEQVIEKAESGEKVTAKEVKELKAKLREKEGEVNTLKQSNQFVTSQLKEQQELVKTANSMMLTEAEKIAEKKVASEVKKATQDLRDELTGLTNKINGLEKEKASAERNSELAKANYEKALEHFKLNPDPETQKAIIELKNTYERTKAQVEMVAISLNELKNKEDQAFSASLSLERFNVAFQKLISNHPDAITAMSSRYLTDASLALIETLADTLDDWAHTIRNSLEMAREEKAKHIEALEVDVVSAPINYFPEPGDEGEW